MYFDGPGRANVARLAFVLGGVEYVDNRIANWPEVKADQTSVPAQLFGSLPCLKHGDMILAQSIAIATYAAELGIWKNSSTPESRAQDLMVLCTNEEMKQSMYKCLFGTDESKEAGRKELDGEVLPKLACLERALERTEGPFFHPEGPGLADLAIYDSLHSPFPGLVALGVDLTPFPKIIACAKAVGENPKIKAFAELGFKHEA